jgi:hypothetical protein
MVINSRVSCHAYCLRQLEIFNFALTQPDFVITRSDITPEFEILPVVAVAEFWAQRTHAA